MTHRAVTGTTVRQQFLGWAVTVHKVQGTEPKQAYVLMNENVFASGQTYVALSRVKHLEDLFLLAFEQGAIYLDERQRELLKWMDSVDICVDGAFPRSSWPPIMPTLPEQSFITKKQHVKKESGSTEQLLIEIKGRQEIKAKQEKIWLVFVVPTLLVQVLESADKIM